MAVFCQNILKLIRQNKNSNAFITLVIRNTQCSLTRLKCYSTQSTTQIYDGRDPAPIFFNKNVQEYLQILTRLDLSKVYRKRKREDVYLEPPAYKFMTSEELEAVMDEARNQAVQKIQMPPVIKVRSDINHILSKDPALHGLDTAKFVFTDISYGIPDSKRIIVTRQPDGTLEHSDWDTRSRMNQIYFPVKGRNYTVPRMFQGEFLKNLLEKHEYEFILDRACIQFEPDDTQYQQVTAETYTHVNDSNQFQILRSTRHFGPMVFYLSWTNNIDNLLTDLIENAHIIEAATLIKLFNTVEGSGKIHNEFSEFGLIDNYIASQANKKAQLELALQAFKERCRQSDSDAVQKSNAQFA